MITVVKEPRKCETCGAPLLPIGTRAHFCKKCKAERVKKQQAKYAAKLSKRNIGDTDVCKRCGKEYTVTSGAQKYCKKCYKELKHDKRAEANKKFLKKKKQVIDEYYDDLANRGIMVCRGCGKAFEYNSQTEEKYCPECVKKRIEKKKNLFRNIGTLHVGDLRKCDNCGEEYEVKGTTQIYCTKCSARIYNERMNKNANRYYYVDKDIYERTKKGKE